MDHRTGSDQADAQIEIGAKVCSVAQVGEDSHGAPHYDRGTSVRHRYRRSSTAAEHGDCAGAKSTTEPAG